MEQIGMDIAELLVLVKFAKTKSEARRHVQNGGVKLGDIKIIDPFARIGLHENKVLILETAREPDGEVTVCKTG